MSIPTTPNLGTIITNTTIRKSIYGSYVVALVLAGAFQVAFAQPELGGQPVWLSVSLNVLAYLGVPIGGLALANAGTPTATVVNNISAPAEVDPTPSDADAEHAATPAD